MPSDISYVVNGPLDAHDLAPLFAHAPWAVTRSVDDVELMLRQTPVQVAARHGQELVGFARALSDGRFRAMIDDVVVVPPFRKHGVGRRLMIALLNTLSDVDEIHLSCRPELTTFYATLGFERSSTAHMYRASNAGRRLPDD